MILVLALGLLFTSSLNANPYPDPRQVKAPILSENLLGEIHEFAPFAGSEVLRVEVSWQADESYSITGLLKEQSGTPALERSAVREDPLGSYKATLRQAGSVFHASVGTGREFRKLVRTLSFRFPLYDASGPLEFELRAENPISGKLEKVLATTLNPSLIRSVPAQPIKVYSLKKSSSERALKVNFYAEGYSSKGEKAFLEAARKAVETLDQHLPGAENFEYQAVFAPSAQALGSARDQGPEIQVRDSFLGLYFPYWRKFGRWYHVLYPTSQTKYRNALAQLPYDYPIALIDDSSYWGVGNYKELTAVPARNHQFTYLLLHEFGHFMGLNEEYEGGGPTELEFAPGILEPWSPNITFHPGPGKLKWEHQTAKGIPLPSSREDHRRFGGNSVNPVGAYLGGYADSEPRRKSHKPVLKCMMASGGSFCPVCSSSIRTLIDQDRGL
jgi:hypothetical protein